MSDSSNQRSITSKDIYSSFVFPDGTVQDVPRDAICRSSLLVRALSGADHDNTFRIFVPYGFLRQWLQWLALKSFVEGHPGAPRKVTAPQLVGFLQAADFLDDGEAVHSLCKLIATCLFGCSVHDRADPKILEDLPETLQLSILSRSHQPLSEHILMLPPHLHMTALHSAYPSIASKNSLCIPLCDAMFRTAPEFLCLLGRLTRLEQLTVSGSHQGRRLPYADVRYMARHVGKLKALRHLSMEGCVNYNDGPESLAFILFNLRGLTHVSLVNDGLSTHGIKALGPHLKKISNLQHLDVGNNDMRANGAMALCAYLSELTCLQHLGLGNNRLTDTGINALAPQFRKLPNLQHLNLLQNNISTAGFRLLSIELPHVASLQGLELGRNEYGLELLLPKFNHLTSLQHLNLGGTLRDDFSEEVVPRMLATHLYNLVHLTDLNLWDSGLGKKGMITLAPVLARLTALQRLNLASNYIRDEGMLALTQHLTNLTRLEHLNLALNHIEGEGLKSLAHCFNSLTRLQHLNLWVSSILMDDDTFTRRLSTLGSLQHLNLKQTDIGAPEAKALARHISGLTGLQYLNLDLNPLKDEGIAALVPALNNLSDLEHLHLQHAGILVQGIESLVQCFSKLHSLQGLFLGKNRIDDKGGAVLAEHMTVLSKLQALDVSHCNMGSKACDAIFDRAKDLPLLRNINIEGNEYPPEGMRAASDAREPVHSTG